MIPPQIVFEDESILILNKPSGWITNDAQTTTSRPVVQKWVRDNISSSLKGLSEFRDGIVHRLDKETSGILIVAKSKDAFEELQRQFKAREVQKTYLALVHGDVRLLEGMIDSPVGRLPWRRDRFGVLPGGREAMTLYKVETKYKNSKNNETLTLLNLSPKTGRTHQIRIHLKHIGHPIVGDDFYAGRKTARADRLWCSRLFLHAKSITFTHPENKKQVYYEADLPPDLTQAFDYLLSSKP